MITALFLYAADVAYRKVTPNVSIPIYGTEPTDLTPNYLVTNEVIPNGNLRTEETSYLQQGDQDVGPLHDRDVKHYHVEAPITVYMSSLFSGVSPSGIPLAQNASGGTLAVTDIVHWGDAPGVVERTLPSYRYYNTYDAKWHLQGPRIGRWHFEFSGNKGLLVSEVYRDANRYESNGGVVIPEQYIGGVVKLRVSGATIYNMGSVSRTTGYYTGGELQTMLNGIPDTGGTTISSAHYVVHGTELSEDQAWDAILIGIRTWTRPTGALLSYHPVDFGELALDCSEQVDLVDRNILLSIFDVEDIVSFHSLWKRLKDSEGWLAALRATERILSGQWRDGDVIRQVKPLANTYLFGKYAVIPLVSDIRAFWGGIKRASSLFKTPRRIHSRKEVVIEDQGSTGLYTAVMTVETTKFPMTFLGQETQLIAGLKRLGLYPEPANLWDMLKYSFVVDWFVQIGDLFEDIDKNLEAEFYFPIKYVIMSEKWSISKPISSVVPVLADGATGIVKFTYYTRWISWSLPIPAISLSRQSLLGKHSVESTFLIFQRLKP